MQPLYLDASVPIDIALEKGPALAITRRGESTRLLPLNLLSHIVAHGADITWSQAALIACAQADIPLFINDEQHHLVAALRANSETPAQDWLRFMRIIEDPEGIDHYQQFMTAKKSQMQKDITDRWRDLPEIHLPGYHRAARILRSAIQADIEAELQRRGFRRRLPLLRQAGIDLSRDLLKIMEPCVHWILNETWKRHVIQTQQKPEKPPARKILLHHYEKHGDLIHDSIRALIVSFLYWLGESDSRYLLTGSRHYE